MGQSSGLNQIQGQHYRFTLLTNQLIRMEYSESGIFEDAPTQMVLNRELGEVSYDIIETEEGLEILTEAFHLYYDKAPFSQNGLFIDAKYNYTPYGNRWYYGTQPPTLKGTARTLDEIDGAQVLEEGIISQNGFALLDDSAAFLLDEQTGEPVPRKHQEIDLYFFAYGHEYLKAIQDFYKLSGKTPLLPRYALGNWWSRYWKYNDQEYLELMDDFKSNQIPLTVSVIDMDWHLTDVPSRFGSGWTGYSWNYDLFPDPEKFTEKLHDKGLAVTLNVHPADGIRAFEEKYPQVAERLGLNQALEEPANFKIDDEAFRAAYFEEIHHPIEAQGIDFWWIDWQQGTVGGESGLDPLWLLNHYHYQDVQRKGKNDIILSRYAGPGSHRYPIGFSGDTIISWDSLAFQPYFTSTASNIGYTWWSHDIGGHMRGYRDDELALRWVQYGVFSPINRLHSSSSPFTGKEPWRYNKIVEESMGQFLRLRHELLPYLYTMNVLTHEQGLPLVQPIYYQFPEAEAAYQVENQYFFGSELMVVPITAKSDPVLQLGKSDSWLPEGTWYDFFTGLRYKGGSPLTVYRSQVEMPIFVPSGGIIPLDKDVMTTIGEALPKTIQWQVFPGEESYQFEMVEDFAGKRAISTLTINWQTHEACLTVEDPNRILPQERQHSIQFKGVKLREENSLFKVESQNLVVTTSDALTPASILDFSSLIQVEKQDVSALFFERINRGEIDYVLKDELWRKFNESQDDLQFIAYLNGLENRSLMESLFEVLYVKGS